MPSQNATHLKQNWASASGVESPTRASKNAHVSESFFIIVLLSASRILAGRPRSGSEPSGTIVRVLFVAKPASALVPHRLGGEQGLPKAAPSANSPVPAAG